MVHSTPAIPPPPPIHRHSNGGALPPAPSLVQGPESIIPNQYSHLTAIQNGVEDNRPGYGDYDIPKPAREHDGTQDYDIPLTKKEREAKERAMGMVPSPPPPPPKPGDNQDVPVYATLIPKDQREKKEKGNLMGVVPLPPSSISGTSSLSGDSRPLSLASSVYSSDTSSISSSSREPEYAVSKKKSSSKLKAQSSLEEQLSALDQLVEDIGQQNAAKKNKKNIEALEDEAGEMHELQTPGKMLSSARSSFSENESSPCGSNDNLGSWDDVSYEEEESGSTSEGEEGVGVVKDEEQRQSKEEVLLDDWIKELESGMKGMAEVAGLDLLEMVSLFSC